MMMNSLNATDIRAIFCAMKDNVIAEREHLIELDSALGDGDLGITMTRGFEEANRTITDLAENDIGRILMKAGMVIAKTAPSTMGTLIATGFMRGGKAVSGREVLGLTDILALFEAFTNGIMERGKARPGEKTVIDTLLPAAETLRDALRDDKTLNEGMSAAYEAAVSGAESTKEMRAVHGRPAYYGDKSIGREDPGAAVGVIIMKAFAEYTAHR